MERTNAMHATLPEKVALITIDVAWTKQRNILPAALKMLSPLGQVVSLIKPHYEADKSQLRKGILPPELVRGVFEKSYYGYCRRRLRYPRRHPKPHQRDLAMKDLMATRCRWWVAA